MLYSPQRLKRLRHNEHRRVATINAAMIEYLYLGRVEYEEALLLQERLVEARRRELIPNLLLLLEHPPVLTLGRNATRANVLATDEQLAGRKIRLHTISRGGDVTYHGPGQLIGYPIFDLRSLRNPSGSRMGPVDFVRGIEEALIRACGVYGLAAGRIPKLTGVWCGLDSPLQRKIAAIGIHVSRGITSHGFAFNLTTNLNDFALINPCGITDRPVTSLERELPGPLPTLEALAAQSAEQFGRVFAVPVRRAESFARLLAVLAEDTPLAIPEEIQRLLHAPEPRVQA